MYKFIKKLVALCTILVIAMSLSYGIPPTTVEICKGNGVKCEADVETPAGNMKVTSEKTKGSASVIITFE
tara:strand:- start:10034 stop:10243 length:210 start_codon:yes stop_codon:yes gene_type:complete